MIELKPSEGQSASGQCFRDEMTMSYMKSNAIYIFVCKCFDICHRAAQDGNKTQHSISIHFDFNTFFVCVKGALHKIVACKQKEKSKHLFDSGYFTLFIKRISKTFACIACRYIS